MARVKLELEGAKKCSKSNETNFVMWPCHYFQLCIIIFFFEYNVKDFLCLKQIPKCSSSLMSSNIVIVVVKNYDNYLNFHYEIKSSRSTREKDSIMLSKQLKMSHRFIIMSTIFILPIAICTLWLWWFQ